MENKEVVFSLNGLDEETKKKFQIDVEKLRADIEKINSCKNEIEVNEIVNAYKEFLDLHQAENKKFNLAEEEKKIKKYKYPFLMYFGHEYRDITGMFEDEKLYKEKEITDILIAHGFKEFKFANSIEYEYFQDENCLFPKIKLGNRG